MFQCSFNKAFRTFLVESILLKIRCGLLGDDAYARKTFDNMKVLSQVLLLLYLLDTIGCNP